MPQERGPQGNENFLEKSVATAKKILGYSIVIGSIGIALAYLL